ncbi:DUF1868 domain-containing protein [Rhizobium sp. 'Codium 1']|uniref:DUF1868 domain-containing protein n=1 Tax=Rhizobium sp. 'Codium 1' TaxID=2940484 RepID=UPI001E2F6FCB|nr:DUF1868 domain-containing protein [Rhizobium sp. 'Codium 1']MCC8932050.1 DUF1868 domain-containing protein [Rhizobium sp. 'Codium 1']
MSQFDVPDRLRSFSSSLARLPIAHLGQRYYTSGTFLRECGNTVVCHLVETSESASAIHAVRARFQAMPGADKLAFTAVSSLHMTLFQGIIETQRALPYWPADVSLEAPVDDMTAIFMDRLARFTPGEAFAIEVTHATPNGLTLDGVTARDRQVLKDWRRRLADLLGYRHPDHDAYVFHMTFAYMVERFDDETMAAWVPFLKDVVEDIRQRSPIIRLRAPAFCAFDDMNHFEELISFEPR